MNIEFDRTDDQVKLVQAMTSTNQLEAAEARNAFAAFISGVIQQVLNVSGTASMIYRDLVYDEDDSPSIPLDLYYGEAEGLITVWYQTVGGGVPTNYISGLKEIKVNTYNVTTAASLDKRYFRRARLDVVSKLMERMANEVLIKQERNAWSVLLKLLANAVTQSQKHVIRSTDSGVFQVDDLNNLIVLLRRLNAAYNGGTPVITESRSLTDLFGSPELKAQVRAFAYQPMNTRAGSVASSGATAIPLPDAVRTGIYNAAGASEIYGVTIHEMLEFGKSRKYNTLFKSYAGSTAYTTLAGADSGAFTNADEEIVVGVDLGRDVFVRPVARNAEHGSTFTVQNDDQFVARSGKIGWFGSLEEGRAILDARAVAGLIV